MGVLTAPANLPFSIALAVVLLLGVLEVVSLLVGGASSLFDSGSADVSGPDMATPDVSTPALGAGADVAGADTPDMDVDGIGEQVLTWLHVGQIPTMILLIVFLLNFGAGGLLMQAMLQATFGAMLPSPLCIAPALVMALPGTRIIGGLLKPVLPRDETEAVSRDSFVGCEAEITVGTARRGAPAEARLRDKFGRSHYVLVEPDKDEDVFPAGSHVLILKRREALYQAIPVTPTPFDS